MAKIALGNHSEAAQPDCVRAVLAEVVLTFLFVFAGVGSAMAAGKMSGGGDTLMALTAIAMAHTLVVAVMIAAGLHISGGHLNPAVTLGLAVGGHITLIRSILYIFAQMVGSAFACLLLKYLTGGLNNDESEEYVDVRDEGDEEGPFSYSDLFTGEKFTDEEDHTITEVSFYGNCDKEYVSGKTAMQHPETPVHTLASGTDAFQGILMEIVLTFSLLFTVYATIVDPKKRVTGGLGPVLVGLVVGANILAGGPFSGASMNPARSFGPALAEWNWTDHWVYWVGPLIGGSLAGFVYENVFTVPSSHAPLPRDDEGF